MKNEEDRMMKAKPMELDIFFNFFTLVSLMLLTVCSWKTKNMVAITIMTIFILTV